MVTGQDITGPSPPRVKFASCRRILILPLLRLSVAGGCGPFPQPPDSKAVLHHLPYLETPVNKKTKKTDILLRHIPQNIPLIRTKSREISEICGQFFFLFFC